jgi:septal ring factor EnvC (AmiA/AmiB activator)
MSQINRLILATLLVTVLVACAPQPADVNTAQQLVDIADAMNALRNENALLQEQIDSLKTVTARQDTIITRLAAQTGVSLPAR